MVTGYKKQKLNGGGAKKTLTLKKKVKMVEPEPEPVEEEEPEEESEESEDEVEEDEDEEEAEEEDVNENLEDLDVLSMDEDDEVDVADVSSSEDDEDNSDYESESEYPKLKKKKNLDDGSESFANAFNAIIGSKLKAYDRNSPILARAKQTLKKVDADKLEAKAKRALNAEKKDVLDNCRVKNLLPSADQPEKVREIIEKEKRLKKIAQRGVVRLFNAVLSTQIKTNEEIGKEKGIGLKHKDELMNEISKEKFLDLVQAAGQP